MEENKQEILNLLLKALQQTRAGDNIVRLEYEKFPDTDDAYVHVINKDKPDRPEYEWLKVNVTGDSGIAMIRDVCEKIH